MNDFERGARKALEEFKFYLCNEDESFWPEYWPLKETEFDSFVNNCITTLLWENNG